MIKSKDLNHFIDLRTSKTIEFGNIKEVLGDDSLIFCTTDKGFRIIMDKHNIKQIKGYKR